AAQGLPSEQEAAVAGDPPAFLEVVRFHFKNSPGRVVACVVNREIHIEARVREERGHVRLLWRVRDEGRRFASGSLDVRDDGIQRGRRTSGRDDVQSLLGEALAKLRAQLPIRADADDQRFLHGTPPECADPYRTMTRRPVEVGSGAKTPQAEICARCASPWPKEIFSPGNS